MAANQQYRTGERVPAAGDYESEAGTKMQYKQGDLFAACPGTGNKTNWKSCIVQ